jgi:hypothetical protein
MFGFVGRIVEISRYMSSKIRPLKPLDELGVVLNKTTPRIEYNVIESVFQWERRGREITK